MISQQLYTNIIRPVLFRRDPEDVHNVATKTGVLIGKSLHARALLRGMFLFRHTALRNTVAGIKFSNPIGLGAGFDKNARLWNVLPEIGFGFAELGSITGEPCAGNPRPRLFRVPKEKSIIVNYGLYNEGSEAIAQRMRAARFRIPIGFSVAKTNDPRLSTAEGIQDYRKAFLAMHPFGSYTTINVSCPNTADGQTFGHPENLEPLLKAIAKEIQVKPVFLKIKPDMNKVAMREVLAIVDKHHWVSGLIVSNLTMHRDGLKTSKEELDSLSLKGGLSGLPVKERSTEMIRFVRKNSDKVIIGCGGIFTGKDAYEKIKSGASLLQLVTSMIYEGPWVVSKINRELVDLMQQDGYGRISEVIDDVSRGV